MCVGSPKGGLGQEVETKHLRIGRMCVSWRQDQGSSLVVA
jgi:hypothetical protein